MAEFEKQQIRAIVSALEDVAEQIIRKLSLDIVAELVKAPIEGGTPVDTGWARANWAPQIGAPRGTPIGDPENVTSAQGQQSSDLAGVLAYMLPSGPVYITNNVPYIGRLNEGTSTQASKGFVQAAITRAVNDLTGLSS